MDASASGRTSSACRRSRRRLGSGADARCARWRATGATGTARRATPASGCTCSKAFSAGAAGVRASRPSTTRAASSPRRLPGVTVASVYVPNGGKDFAAKMRFLEAMDAFVAQTHAAGEAARDLRRPERRADRHRRASEGAQAGAIGQLPGGARAARADPRPRAGRRRAGRSTRTNDQLFTWWAPWRNMRQRNIGWRLDYVLASQSCFRSCRRAASFIAISAPAITRPWWPDSTCDE